MLRAPSTVIVVLARLVDVDARGCVGAVLTTVSCATLLRATRMVRGMLGLETKLVVKLHVGELVLKWDDDIVDA